MGYESGKGGSASADLGAVLFKHQRNWEDIESLDLMLCLYLEIKLASQAYKIRLCWIPLETPFPVVPGKRSRLQGDR